MSYTLYYSPDSANLVARMVLEELKLDYQAFEVPRKRSDRSAEFFALNPRGLLPVLVDHETDAPVAETGAVALYLADKHGGLAPSSGSAAARGAFLKWLFMIANTLHADLAMCFYPQRYADTAENAERVKAVSTERVHSHFQLLNEAIETSSSDWFLSSGLSICDFYLGCCFRWSQLYPAEQPTASAADLARYPALVDLLSRLAERVPVKVAAEKEGIVGPVFLAPTSPLPMRTPDEAGV